jgi:hypothetical protein
MHTSAEVRCAHCGELLHADTVNIEPGPAQLALPGNG